MERIWNFISPLQPLLYGGLGYLINDFLKKRGKITCITNDFTFRLFKRVGNGFGGFKDEKPLSLGTVNIGRYSMKLCFFYDSDIQGGLTNIRLLLKNKKFEVEAFLQDTDSRKVVANRTVINTLNTLNLPSRQMVELKLEGQIDDKAKIEKIFSEKYTDVYIIATKDNNKKFETKIATYERDESIAFFENQL